MAGAADQLEKRCINCQWGRFIPKTMGINDRVPVDKIQKLCPRPDRGTYKKADEAICDNQTQYTPKET